jgi:hypothetical protein
MTGDAAKGFAHQVGLIKISNQQDAWRLEGTILGGWLSLSFLFFQFENC